MADCDGLQDDPLALGSYSQLLFSDEVDNLSTDGCFNFTSSFSSENPPKTLCFGGCSEECDLGFDDSCTRVAQKTGVALTCNDSSSTKNSNAMDKSLEKSNVSELSAFTVVDTIKKEKKKCLKKRNVSGLGAHDEQVQKNRNSDVGNGNEKAPARSQRNCKKTKSDNSSATGHAKVKKEKLGERILALQQLVSPFGKTDTASVLDEAMGYIRFLHDQVEVLCSPYSQRLPSSAHQQQEDGENGEGEGESRKDLRSKGLCLVPVELTLHVAEDNGADFWSPAMVNSVSSNQRVIFLAMHGLPTAKFVL